jgi:hypothetical protein
VTAADRYLDLLKACLTRDLFADPDAPAPDPFVRRRLDEWPPPGETMIGRPRLDQLQRCVESVIADGVAGDLFETGVWRGGASIFMRGVLAAHDDAARAVWLADSFEGLPAPDIEHYPADEGLDLHTYEALAVSLDTVRANFARYGLLDDRVHFLKGWFKDTLTTAPVERIAVLRLDGDMYGSTQQALDALYPKVSAGGYVVVDDYGAYEPCARAVHDYRAAHGIDEPIEAADWSSVHWRKGQPGP